MKVRSILHFLILFLFCSSLHAQQRFSQSEVLADLEYLRTSLIDAHYNVYAFTTEQAFDATYQAVKSSIDKDSLSLLETINRYQRFIAVVKNGHTNINFPIQPYIEYAYAGGTVFPLEIAFEHDKPLIRKNWSANDSLRIGSELLSINGVQIAEILDRIYPQIAAERRYFQQVMIEAYSFPRYYWQVFGQQDEFTVEISNEGKINNYTLKPITVLEGYEEKREEVLNATLQLKFYDQAAYLNPGNFGGDEAAYRRFMDSAFVEIKANKSKNLIIDLRNNRGGDDTFSDYLVSYIADRPFKWNSSFTLKTSAFLKAHTRQHFDTTDVYWQQVLTHEDGAIYDYPFEAYQPQPESKRFQGKVYVLVNRQSHSQAAVTAAQIQDYQFGTIVGEETGEYASLYASIFEYELPLTGIVVHVSKGRIIRVNGSTDEAGVMPDIPIKDYLLDETDEVLDGLLARIQ